MKNILLVLALALGSFGALANTPSVNGFSKHFKLKRDVEGNISQILDMSLKATFSIAPYVRLIKNALIEEQKIMSQEGDYETEVFNTLGVNPNLESSDDIENARIVVKSLKSLQNLNVDKVFKSKSMNDLLHTFERKLSDTLSNLDPRVVADINHSNFFYKRNVTHKVVMWALDFAKKKFSTIPILNTASFVIVKVEEMIRKRRLFHQNMLLHYLENFNEADLGMTHDEVNKAISSIYESRIEWFAYWESKNAVSNWNKYGINKFFTELRTGNTRLRNLKNQTRNGKRINFAFQEAWVDGQHVILNLFNTKNKYDNNMAIAYYYDKPEKIKRQRMILELAQLGLSNITLPDWLKGMAEDYITSFYKAQQLTEGSLMAYFETMNDESGMQLVRNQYINPFDNI